MTLPRKLAGLAAIIILYLLIWAALFAPTFRDSFHWDDFHLIRHYSAAEMQSVFHGVVDPDKIETPSLRPVSILFYNFQYALWGENVVLHRVFMLALGGTLLMATGLVLLETGLNFFQIAVVFALFVFSRVFASLVLWISLSHVLLSYIWIISCAYFFLLWAKGRSVIFLFLLLGCAAIATFIREEAYTLPVTLPLIWWIASSDHSRWRRVAAAAIGLFAIMGFHYWLWHHLITDALAPQFTGAAIGVLIKSIEASWLPGGKTMVGQTDLLLGFSWIGFLLLLLVLFLRSSRAQVRWRVLSVCCLGAILCLPALGIARPYGIALPTLAFMAAVVIAGRAVFGAIPSGNGPRNWRTPALALLTILGIAVGLTGGIRRSYYVKESLQENEALRAMRDGVFLFNLTKFPVTIPEERRQADVARLATLGIKSPEDVTHLQKDVLEHPEHYRGSGDNGRQLFLSKYKYLSY